MLIALTPMLYQLSVKVGYRVLGRTDPELAARYSQQDRDGPG